MNCECGVVRVDSEGGVSKRRCLLCASLTSKERRELVGSYALAAANKALMTIGGYVSGMDNRLVVVDRGVPAICLHDSEVTRVERQEGRAS